MLKPEASQIIIKAKNIKLVDSIDPFNLSQNVLKSDPPILLSQTIQSSDDLKVKELNDRAKSPNKIESLNLLDK
jgi:hypothetical protein